MDKVTAGAALNLWVDVSTQTILKETGSQLHGNPGAVLGGNGTLNQNHHFPF
jgi:hypothetical protein